MITENLLNLWGITILALLSNYTRNKTELVPSLSLSKSVTAIRYVYLYCLYYAINSLSFPVFIVHNNKYPTELLDEAVNRCFPSSLKYFCKQTVKGILCC